MKNGLKNMEEKQLFGLFNVIYHSNAFNHLNEKSAKKRVLIIPLFFQIQKKVSVGLQ